MSRKSVNEKMPCIKCGKLKTIDKNFYLSTSPSYPTGRYPICRTCILDGIDVNNVDTVKDTLLEMNKPFIYTLWVSSLEESKKTNKHPFGIYMKNVNFNFKNYTWKDSEFNESKTYLSVVKDDQKNNDKYNDVDENLHVEILDAETENQDKKDVIRLLGYDPFEYESKEDQKQLYSRLVDFLDESTLEDGLKLQSVIEIVKGFNQVDKINQAISKLTNNLENVDNNTGGIKSLISSKKEILQSVLKLAEDNGISVKHNNQKSKGAGTLSGIIKQLQEKGFEEAEVNLFDIETCEAMRQIADISNESIMKQLQFDENDYTQMIIEQREMIQELESKVMNLEEENRKLRKELLRLKDSDING